MSQMLERSVTTKTLRVLVVDDSLDDRLEVRRLLLKGSEQQYQFMEAETGEAAIRSVLSPEGVDCVVLDFHLPDMDAPEILAEITQLNGLPACPVVVVTGSGDERFGKEVLRAGAQDFIGKDWMTAKGLTRTIENAIDRWDMACEIMAREVDSARLAAIVTCTDDAVVGKNLDGIITTWNQGAERLFGYQSCEILGHPVDILIPQDRLDEERECFHRVKDGETVFLETVRRRKDGTQIEASLTLSPVKDSHGSIIGAAKIARDVSSRKRTEEALRRQEAEYRMLFEAAGTGNTEVSIATRQFVRVNKKFCELVGYSAEELLSGMSFLDITHPDDRACSVEEFASLFEGKSDTCEFEKRFLRKNGDHLWVHLTSSLIRDVDGLPSRLLGSAVDITARKAERELLEHSEARLELALAGGDLGVWDWDISSGNVSYDERWAGMLGYSGSEVTGSFEFWKERLHPDDRERVLAALSDHIAGKVKSYRVEHRLQHRSGKWVWILSSGRIVERDVSGKPTRACGTHLDITVLKEAVDQVIRNHDTFAQIIRSNPFGVYVIDADFRVWQVSQGAELVFAGVNPIIGRDFNEVLRILWPESFAVELSQRFQHTLATGELYVAPSTVERREDIGETESYDWRIERVMLPDGRHGVVCYFYDLTQRQRLESSLIEKERELRLLTDNTPDILSRFDRNFVHVFVNAAAERATGRPRHEFIGKTNRELGMPPDLCDVWEGAIQYVFDSGMHKSIEFSFPGPEGIRHYSAQLVPEVGTTESTEFVLGVTHDITESKRAEQIVRESEERLTRAQHAAGVGTWDWDVSSGLATWTEEAWKLFGPISRDLPVTYELWLSCIHPEDRAAAAAATAAALSGDSYHDTFRVCRNDGTILWIESDGAVVRDESGSAVRLLGTVRDVTERKHAEIALTDADRRKDEFLAMLGHELRNPLAPISNAVQLLRFSGSQDPNLISATDVIERQVRHLVRLVDDLLDTSRVSRGKVQLQFSEVALKNVVTNTIETVQYMFESKNHTITVQLPDEELTMNGDFARLTQIFGNLLTNAAKYTDDGGHIWVSLKKSERLDGYATFSVRDNGRGIDAKAISNLFDLFYQVDSSLDRSDGGLGIGLALVKSLVELHGGQVEASSLGRGHGSEFSVHLPCTVSSQALRFSESLANTTSPSVMSTKVLVVDDNRDSATLLAMLLKVDGHTVMIGHDGKSAVELALQERPEVILLDIGLPQLNGYEACRMMREAGLTGSLIVAMTGYGQAVDRQSSKDAGFDNHLTKPVENATVRQVIAERNLKQERAERKALRILVVDDMRDARLMLSTLLKASGNEVRIAVDGPSAISTAIDFLPNVILIDNYMPGMSGLEVAKRIRQHTVLEGVVLIAMTGSGEDEDRQRSLEAGFDFHLVKPANINDVNKILATLK